MPDAMIHPTAHELALALVPFCKPIQKPAADVPPSAASPNQATQIAGDTDRVSPVPRSTDRPSAPRRTTQRLAPRLGRPMKIGIGAAGLFVILGILGGVLLTVRTRSGEVVIQLSDPTAKVEVKVDGDKIELSGLDRPSDGPALAGEPIKVIENDDSIQIDTDTLQAKVRKKGYVSGIAAGTLLDRKTGAHDLGFGLHIMDFLLAPGWRDDGYSRDAMHHGSLPKHYVEGPQICTQAKELRPKIVRGPGFVAIKLGFTFTKPGDGYKAGSTWEQTLVFLPGVRYILSGERMTSANAVEGLFYRIDMPGHIKHKGGDDFVQVYLSYLDKPIAASKFQDDFAPDARYLYQRREGKVPERMIRAYQVKRDGKPGPWLAGMTLDPAAVSEAWCHERGYVCFIEELGGRKVKAGETFGAAYIVGWFDDVAEMDKVYDRYKGKRSLVVAGERYRLE
jgi:hypothetical protein